jgi:hypothetical protein
MIATSGISDALSQVEAIEEQIEQLQSGELLNSALGIASTSGGDSTGATTSTDATAGTSSTAFAEELAAALGGESDSADATDATSTDASYDSGLGTSDASALLSSLSTGTGTSTGASVALPSAASSLLTGDQQTFASTLAAKTGLNPGVVSAWLLAEESGGAAQSRQAEGNNDWLNIGYTGSGTYGASDSIWSNPTSAANATAEWLQGEDSILGYGTASTGIRSILGSVGQSPATQIQALQDSGWAGSGYPSLPGLYSEVSA